MKLSISSGALTDPQAIEAMRLAIKNRTNFSDEILNYRKDGTIFWNYLTLSPVRDDLGNMVGETIDKSLAATDDWKTLDDGRKIQTFRPVRLEFHRLVPKFKLGYEKNLIVQVEFSYG